ncbi:MAG: peptidoglycan DD-metalloendopeptidase family protein [Chloroflexota bacterium]
MVDQQGFGFRSVLFWVLGVVALGAFVWQVLSAPENAVSEFLAETAVFTQTADEAETAVPNPEATDNSTEQSVTLFNNLPTINEDSLALNPNPRTYQAKSPNHNFVTHTVARGETPNVIADQYEISSETLLGGNPWLNQESNALQSGAELVILPVDGVLHEVQPGETLASIAEIYSVTIEEIAAYESNNLEAPFYRLVPETEILIPGATVGQFYWTAPKSVGGSGNQQWQIVGTGFFSWPINSRCMTQFYWYGHPGIDVGLPEGSSVVAADHGTVTYASWASGSYYDYGNLIVLNHGNGFETLYAHLSSINVFPGQIVRQGDFIGLTGNTGRSSGPHLHFEIRLNDFRDDPLFYLGGAVQSC